MSGGRTPAVNSGRERQPEPFAACFPGQLTAPLAPRRRDDHNTMVWFAFSALFVVSTGTLARAMGRSFLLANQDPKPSRGPRYYLLTVPRL